MPSHARAALITPDGRYLVVRGRLWRASDPNLPASDRERLVALLMDARRQLRGEASAEVRAAAAANTSCAEWFDRIGAARK